MAEFDPIQSKDATEAAYAQALLADEAGREQRRARLMAALPRPEAPAATPVARSELAWRWQPYAMGLFAAGLLLAAMLALKGRPSEPVQKIDPRLAAASAASTPVVVAQVQPPGPPTADARVAAAPPMAVKVIPAKPQVKLPPPSVVVADAGMPQQRRETEAAVKLAAESARLAVEPPPMAAAPVTPPAAPAAPKPVPPQVENRADATAGFASARSRAPQAAAEARPEKLATPVDTQLLAAVDQADLARARSALQAGASVQSRDAQGRTPLMLAARHGSREMVDLLLSAGAGKTDRDARGWTATDHARDRGHDELAERLR